MAGKLNRKIFFLNVKKSNVASELVAFAKVCHVIGKQTSRHHLDQFNQIPN